jgi:hypothetical protein
MSNEKYTKIKEDKLAVKTEGINPPGKSRSKWGINEKRF